MIASVMPQAFARSWQKRVTLEEAQKDLNLPVHVLITKCQARYGAREKTIDRILEQVLYEDRMTWKFQHGKTDVLESVNKELRPMQEFTDYVSVWSLKPVLTLLNTTLLLIKEDKSDLTKSLKNEMLEYINEKYEDADTQELLDVASFFRSKIYNTLYHSRRHSHYQSQSHVRDGMQGKHE